MAGAISSTGRVDYNTPAHLLVPVRKFFGGQIELDPCSNLNSLVDAELNIVYGNPESPSYHISDSGGTFVFGNGLKSPWNGTNVFVNPPFRTSKEWILKAVEEVKQGAEVIFLIPDSPETKIWKNTILLKAAGRCQLKQRVKFVGMKNTITKPVSFVYFGKYPNEFKEVFKTYGRVENPQEVYADQADIVL